MLTINVTARGPDFAGLIKGTVADLKAANKAAGKEVAKRGVKAVKKDAPRVGGKKLSVRYKNVATPVSAVVTFRAHTVGGWMMHEKGTKPHAIRPRHAGRNGRPPALKMARYAADVYHPGTAGTGAWTKALARLKAAVKPAITDVYDEALSN